MGDRSKKVSYILAASQFCLAGALIYFTFELSRLATQIPDILSAVEKTSEKIEPVVNEVSEIRDQIPPILKEVEQVRKQIPAIIQEVQQIREQLPVVLAEMKEVRELVPSVLEETKHIRAQVPLVLTEARLYRKQIPLILDEIKEVRIIIPDVLAEVERTREAIPPMLSQGERMIGEASKAGRRASEGAVTGVITGIFKAPFKLVGGLGRAMFGSSTQVSGLTEGDENLASNTAAAILATGYLGEKRQWANPDSGNDGTISIKEVKLIDGKECRVINSIVRIKGEEKINSDVTACRNKDSEWEMLNE